MYFRIKKAYAHPILNEATYDPMEEVVMGSDYWEERTNLNGIYVAGALEEFEAEKLKVFAKIRRQAKAKGKAKTKNASDVEEGESDPAEPTEDVGAGKKGGLAPWCLRLYLRHGDFVVMHGANIHKSYEVSLRNHASSAVDDGY